MTPDMALVLLLLVGAVVLFATERLPVELTALLVLAALLVTGILEPAEGFGGFGNPATVTIGAMFVLSAGLARTGALNVVGDVLSRLLRWNLWAARTVLMLVVGAISGFINNTAAVAVFLPSCSGRPTMPGWGSRNS